MSGPSGAKNDLSGRSQLTRNVAFAWAGYLVNISSGFVIPRLISDQLGQHTLGLWDFTWSVIGYFGLLQLGIGASADRFIARHRARGDMVALSRSVSTIGLSFTLSGCLIILLTLATVFWLLPAFGGKIGDDLANCQWVVFFLGLEGSLTLMLTIYGAMIVGSHRWDLHNTISASTYGLTMVGMVLSLTLGMNLPTLAAVHCFFAVCGEVVRWRLSDSVCPGVRVHFGLASWEVWLEQFRFSAKNLIPRVADLMSNQTLSLLIAAHLGPAMLAVYSRPRGLLRSLQMFSAKFGSILVPASSSLEASSDFTALRQTFLQSTGFIAAIATPGVIALLVFGDSVIRLWMGPTYVYPGIVTILATSAFFSIVQEPVWAILAGMNRHGRIAIIRFAGACCSAAMLALGFYWLKYGLLAGALAFALPQLIIDAAYTPARACRILGVPLSQYYRRTLLRPLLCSLPYLIALLLARAVLPASAGLAVFLALAGLTILTLIYWRYLLPSTVRSSLLAHFSKLRRSIAPSKHVAIIKDRRDT